MSRRMEPPYLLGADPASGDVWKIYRGSDTFLYLFIDLPSPLTTGSIYSDSTITAGYAHIREAVADALPKLIMGNTEGRLYMTVTRPSATRVEIEIHIPADITESSLDLVAGQDTPQPRRVDIPGRGFVDVLLETSDGEFHFVWRAAVEAIRMVTRLSDEA